MAFPRIVVLYGSQTGTAKDVAERAFRDARRHHFTAKVSALDDYPVVCCGVTTCQPQEHVKSELINVLL